jgi:uncharacterized protein YodC (DUF2158 family)
MENALHIGDVVRLKSGGPKMTITTIGDLYGTPNVYCTWFDGVKQYTGDFPPNALELVTESTYQTPRRDNSWVV